MGLDPVEVFPDRAQKLRDLHGSGRLGREALAPFFPALSIEPGNIRRLVPQRSVRAEQPTVLGVGSLCLPDFFRHVRLEIELRDIRQRIATDNIVASVLFHHKSNPSKRFQRLADGS